MLAGKYALQRFVQSIRAQEIASLPESWRNRVRLADNTFLSVCVVFERNPTSPEPVAVAFVPTERAKFNDGPTKEQYKSPFVLARNGTHATLFSSIQKFVSPSVAHNMDDFQRLGSEDNLTVFPFFGVGGGLSIRSPYLGQAHFLSRSLNADDCYVPLPLRAAFAQALANISGLSCADGTPGGRIFAPRRHRDFVLIDPVHTTTFRGRKPVETIGVAIRADWYPKFLWSWPHDDEPDTSAT